MTSFPEDPSLSRSKKTLHLPWPPTEPQNRKFPPPRKPLSPPLNSNRPFEKEDELYRPSPLAVKLRQYQDKDRSFSPADAKEETHVLSLLDLSLERLGQMRTSLQKIRSFMLVAKKAETEEDFETQLDLISDEMDCFDKFVDAADYKGINLLKTKDKKLPIPQELSKEPLEIRTYFFLSAPSGAEASSGSFLRGSLEVLDRMDSESFHQEEKRAEIVDKALDIVDPIAQDIRKAHQTLEAVLQKIAPRPAFDSPSAAQLQEDRNSAEAKALSRLMIRQKKDLNRTGGNIMSADEKALLNFLAEA